MGLSFCLFVYLSVLAGQPPVFCKKARATAGYRNAGRLVFQCMGSGAPLWCACLPEIEHDRLFRFTLLQYANQAESGIPLIRIFLQFIPFNGM